MKSSNITTAAVGALAIGLITNGVYAAISGDFDKPIPLASMAIAAAIVLGYLGLAVAALVNSMRRGRYAVLVFVLNSENQLLLIKHPYHGAYLPPGGRLNPWEPPHVGIGRVLKEEAGLENFRFDSRFHEKEIHLSKRVEQVRRPIAMHMEHRQQRFWIPFHFSMLYVCSPPDDHWVPPPNSAYQPSWLSLNQIYALKREEYPFDDIIRRYEQILRHIGVPVGPIPLEQLPPLPPLPPPTPPPSTEPTAA